MPFHICLTGINNHLDQRVTPGHRFQDLAQRGYTMAQLAHEFNKLSDHPSAENLQKYDPNQKQKDAFSNLS